MNWSTHSSRKAFVYPLRTIGFTPRTFTRKMDKGNRGIQRLKSSHPFLYHHTSRINPVNSGCRKQTGLASDSVDCSYQLRALKCKRCIGWDKIIYQASILPVTTGTCFHGFGLTETQISDGTWRYMMKFPCRKLALICLCLIPLGGFLSSLEHHEGVFNSTKPITWEQTSCSEESTAPIVAFKLPWNFSHMVQLLENVTDKKIIILFLEEEMFSPQN